MSQSVSGLDDPVAESTRVQVRSYSNRFLAPKSLSQLYCLSTTCVYFKNLRQEHLYLSKIKFYKNLIQSSKRRQDSFLTPRPPMRPRLNENSPEFSGMSRRKPSTRLESKRETDSNPYNQGASISTRHLFDRNAIVPLNVLQSVSQQIVLNSTTITTTSPLLVPGMDSPNSSPNVSVMDIEAGDILRPPVLQIGDQERVIMGDPSPVTVSEPSNEAPASPTLASPTLASPALQIQEPEVSEALARLGPSPPFPVSQTQAGAQHDAADPVQTQSSSMSSAPSQGHSTSSVANTVSSSSPTQTTGSGGMASLGVCSPSRTQHSQHQSQHWMLATLQAFMSLIECHVGFGDVFLHIFRPNAISNAFCNPSYVNLTELVTVSLSIPRFENWANPIATLTHIGKLLHKYIPGDIERQLMNQVHASDNSFKFLAQTSEDLGLIRYTDESWESWGYLFNQSTLDLWLNLSTQVMTIRNGQASCLSTLRTRLDSYNQAVSSIDSKVNTLSTSGRDIADLQTATDQYLTRNDDLRTFLDIIFQWKNLTTSQGILAGCTVLKTEVSEVSSMEELFRELAKSQNTNIIIDTRTQSIERMEWEPMCRGSHIFLASQDALSDFNKRATEASRHVAGVNVNQTNFPPLPERSTTASVVSPQGRMTPVTCGSGAPGQSGSRPTQAGSGTPSTTAPHPPPAIPQSGAPAPQLVSCGPGLAPPTSAQLSNAIIHQVTGPGLHQNLHPDYIRMLSLMNHFGVFLPGAQPNHPAVNQIPNMSAYIQSSQYPPPPGYYGAQHVQQSAHIDPQHGQQVSGLPLPGAQPAHHQATPSVPLPGTQPAQQFAQHHHAGGLPQHGVQGQIVDHQQQPVGDHSVRGVQHAQQFAQHHHAGGLPQRVVQGQTVNHQQQPAGDHSARNRAHDHVTDQIVTGNLQPQRDRVVKPPSARIYTIEDDDDDSAPTASRRHLISSIMNFRNQWSFPQSSREISELPEDDLNEYLAEISVYLEELKLISTSISDFNKQNRFPIKISRPHSSNPSETVDQEAGAFIRECKIYLTKIKSKYDSRLMNLRESSKAEQQSILKSMSNSSIPELKYDSEIVIWMIEIRRTYEINQTYKGPPERLALEIINSIKLQNLRSHLEPVKDCPRKILLKVNQIKFQDGYASKMYFLWTLVNREHAISTVPSHKRKAAMLSRLSNYCTVYSNLKMLEKLNDIPLGDLKMWAEQYAFGDNYLKDWVTNLCYFSSCRTAQSRQSCINNLRNRKVISDSSLNPSRTLDDTSNVSLRDEASFLDNSALDVMPLSSRNNTSRTFVENPLGSIVPSYAPVSVTELFELLVVYCEGVMAQMWQLADIDSGPNSTSQTKGKASSGSHPASKYMSSSGTNTNVSAPDTSRQLNDTDNYGGVTQLASLATSSAPELVMAPIVEMDVAIFLRKDVLAPDLANTPMPIPIPGDNVLKKYKSISCFLPGCSKSHPNGTVYYCVFFMVKTIVERLTLVRQFKICNQCLCQHDTKGGKCQSSITCIWCKAEGRPYDHNSGVCTHSRYRFPCVRPVTVQKAHINLDERQAMDDSDFSDIQTSVFPNSVSVIPDPTQTPSSSSEPAGISDIFKNLPENYFSKTKELLEILSRKIKEKKSQERRDPSSVPSNDVFTGEGEGGVSASVLTNQNSMTSQISPQNETFSDLTRLAFLETPQYLQVKQLENFYNFLISSLPLRAESRIPRSRNNLFFKIADFHDNLCMVEADRKHNITSFSSCDERFIVTRPNNMYNEIYNTILKKQVLIHSIFRTSTLNFGKISFEIYLDKMQRFLLDKFDDIYIFHSGDNQCVVTIFGLYDTGCSGLCLATEVLNVLDPVRLRQINLKIQTANGNYGLNSHEFSLQVLNKDGASQSVVVQELKGNIGINPLSPKQAAILNFDFGSFEGDPNYFNRFCQSRTAYILIGQSHPSFRTTEAFNPKYLGFENFPLMCSRMRTFYASDLFHESVLFSGEVGTDVGAADKNHFIIVPAQTIDEQKTTLKPNTILEDDWLTNPQKLDHNFVTTLTQDAHLSVAAPSSTSPSKLDAPPFESLDFIQACSDQSLVHVHNMIETAQIEMPGNKRSRVYLTKPESDALADFIFAESTLLTPLLLCKHHDRISKQCASSCDHCKLLNSASDTMRDYGLYKKIWDNLSLVPDPVREGQFYPLQELQFIDSPEFIGRLAASNYEAALASSRRLVKKALTLDCLEMLDNQMKERIQRNELVLLELEELEAISNEEIYSQFVLNNYVCAPEKSTKFRLVMNSSLPILGSPRTLASSNRAPKTQDALQDLYSVSIRKKLSTYCISGDIKRAYLSVHYSKENSFLFLTVWFKNPENGTDQPYVARFIVLQFGNGQASTILSIVLDKFGATRVLFPESRKSILLDKYVDNLFSMSKHRGTCARIMKDIKTTCDSINLEIDKLFVTHDMFDSDDAEVKDFISTFNIVKQDKTIGFGYEWDLSNDTWLPFMKVTVHPHQRGMPLGPGLEMTDLNKVTFTRQLMCKLVPSYYDCLGVLLGCVISSAKILLCRVCKVCPLDRQTEPISLFDSELDKTLIKFFTQTKRFFTEFQPLKRTCIPENHKVLALIFSHDGSVEAHSSVCHVLTENKLTGERQSSILTAKQTTSSCSPFVNECRSYVLSALHAFSVVKAGLRFLEEFEDLQIIFSSDNQPSSHCFQGRDPVELISRTTKFAVLRICFEIESILPNIVIKQIWNPGSEQAADLNSKLNMKPLEAANSSLWREGSQFYLDLELLCTFTFLHYHKGSWVYHRLPAFKNTTKMSFLEIVDCYKQGNLSREPPQRFCRGVGLISDSLESKDSHNIEVGVDQAPRTSQRVDNSLFTIPSVPAHRSQLQCTLCPGHSNDQSLPLPHIETIHPSEQTMIYANSVLHYDDGFNKSCLNEILNQKTFLDPDFCPINDCQPKCEQSWSFISQCEENIEEDNEILEESYLFYFTLFSTATQCSVLTRSKLKLEAKNQENLAFYQLNRISRVILTRTGDNIAFVDSATFKFSKSLYLNIIDKRDDFCVVLNMFRNVIKFVLRTQKHRPSIPNGLNFELYVTLVCWRSIIISDQSLFPPSSKRGKINKHNDILHVTLTTEGRTLPILSKDSPLLRKFIEMLHRNPSGYPLLSEAHLHQKSTLSLLYTSSFSIYCDNLKEIIRKVIHNCFGCRRINLVNFKCPVGPRHVLTNPESRLFSVCSIDPCFFLRITNFPKGKQSFIFIPVLAIMCESSAVLSLIPMISEKHSHILLALKCFESLHNCRVDVIISDAGSALNQNLLESKSRYKVINHRAGCQSKNGVERRIGLAKKIFRSIFRCYKSESGKYLTPLNYCELLYLCSMISLAVNTIPYAARDSTGFSPSHLIHHSGLAESFERELVEGDFSGHDPMGTLRGHMIRLKELRNEALISMALDADNLCRDKKYRGSGEQDISREDLVLYCPSSLNKGVLGLVTKVWRDSDPKSNDISIRTEGGDLIVDIERLFLLVPAKYQNKTLFSDELSSEVQRGLEKE